VSDSDIADAIAAGANSIEEIQAQLGVATCCGQCMDFAETCIEDAKQSLFYNAA
jgi:bacterioferritin-associated ferredoxin